MVTVLGPRFWVQVLIMPNALLEDELVTYFLAPTDPISLRLRRSTE